MSLDCECGLVVWGLDWGYGLGIQAAPTHPRVGSVRGLLGSVPQVCPQYCCFSGAAECTVGDLGPRKIPPLRAPQNPAVPEVRAAFGTHSWEAGV